MTKDLGLFILDVLKDFNYDGQKESKYLSKVADDKDRILGLTMFRPKNPIIYVAKDQSSLSRTHTQLHEFAHVYYAMIGKMDADEDDVDKLAQHWYNKGMGLK